jgi:C-terminal processing protease CtpA/Prc
MGSWRWRMRSSALLVVTLGALALAGCTSTPPTETPTPAPSATAPVSPTPDPIPTRPPATEAPTSSPTEEPGGPRIVTGRLTYTNPFFTEGVAQPVILLEDQTGFVIRDPNYVIPIESQVLGQITTDFESSPLAYSLTLPAEPKATLHDVDNDGRRDAGVMVFAVAYWNNIWGDPFLERRDQGGGGWSTAYASTRVSDDRDTYREVYGGKLLVYAPDDGQGFPSGFGDDGMLFTADDPVMPVPPGWSVVDLDQAPFALDRSEHPEIELVEPEDDALDDFSGLSYSEAFDRLVDKFASEYAFSELKGLDWESVRATFGPRFEQAERLRDRYAYSLALRDFVWSIPDAHVAVEEELAYEELFLATAGGVGMSMTETDGGEFVVTYLLADGPAAEAGVEWGAEIIEIDERPTAEVVAGTVPWTGPFSNPIHERLHSALWSLRFPADRDAVEVRFRNPGGRIQSETLPVVEEYDSIDFGLLFGDWEPAALPVEFDLLDSGFGILRVNSFMDNDVLTIQLWERALGVFREYEAPAVIIDMRQNGGGRGWLADQMAAYFFRDEIVVGTTAYYDDSTGGFETHPGDEKRMLPPPPGLQFHGPVAVIVGPGCYSACEFFSYDMTIDDRALIVGQYPTAGAGGSVEQVAMPNDATVQLTVGRALDAGGRIHIEGRGVVPEVKVPVTLDTLEAEYRGEDPVLAAAEEALEERTGSR